MADPTTRPVYNIGIEADGALVTDSQAGESNLKTRNDVPYPVTTKTGGEFNCFTSNEAGATVTGGGVGESNTSIRNEITCTMCGQATGETVFYLFVPFTPGPPYWTTCRHPICEGCALEQSAWWTPPKRCEGCARLMRWRTAIHLPRRFCSTPCWRRWRRDRRSAPKPCPSCGAPIPMARRSDTRYCSPACKQKAWRSGRTAGTGGVRR